MCIRDRVSTQSTWGEEIMIGGNFSMAIEKTLKQKASGVMIGTLLDQAVKYVHKDPINNFDKLASNLIKLEKLFPASNGVFSKFINWTESNPGSKQWFIELLSRDENQIRTFMKNMFVNVSLEWMQTNDCLLYTSDAADDTPCVDLGGRRIINKKKTIIHETK
eukprot:TRINITY_DN69497_c0_g1_i1.p2 TRINITY_DN69497_c0_g1~~TRINITY_DN69497_c0_g1_i1.p2  ORF type:complete len:163 (+),score=38.78 TRINITY_DN69497_c0_g1_i1:140-628(+)